MDTDLGEKIHNKALECGYDDCGVVSLDILEGYRERLLERLEKYPDSSAIYGSPLAFLRIQEDYPRAKAMIVCTEYFGKYRFPASLQGIYAKSFLLASCSPGYPGEAGKIAFEKWLTAEGISFVGGATNMPGKMIPLREAAVAAGLGIYRKNNFFYGPKGSWYSLEGYLIDRSCEFIRSCELKPCPEGCNLCRRACKTGSLSAPYTMDPLSCTAFLNTFGEGKIEGRFAPEQLEGWIMGCDACQDACPYNREHNWDEGESFPGLDEIEELLQPINLLAAADEELETKVIPRSEHHLQQEQTAILRRNAERVLSLHHDK